MASLAPTVRRFSDPQGLWITCGQPVGMLWITEICPVDNLCTKSDRHHTDIKLSDTDIKLMQTDIKLKHTDIKLKNTDIKLILSDNHQHQSQVYFSRALNLL